MPHVVIVDPLSFSLPYDHSLCTALLTTAWRPTLVFDAADEGPAAAARYERWNGYRADGPLGALPMPRKARRALRHVGGMHALVRRLRAAPPDAIHFQWLPLPALEWSAVRRLRGVAPLVLTLHNTTLFHGSPTSRIQGLGFAGTVARFDHVIVHTEYSRRRVIEQGWMDASRVSVIPHGVLDYYRVSRNDGGRPAAPPSATAAKGEHVILFFGSLKPYKGVDVLVDAFGRLPEALRARTKLVIAGQPGMDLAPLRARAESGGFAERIDWRLGHVREGDVGRLFEEADVVALPYREIDQSGVLLTAIALRRPIVASRIGGIPETVHDGEHALLSEPGDAAALAQGLERLLGDPALRARHERALDALAEGPLAWRTIARRTSEVYETLRARVP